MEIYLSLELQTLLFSCQRVVFIVTSILGGLSLFCLIKKTPSNNAEVRSYLVVIQVLVMLSSVYLDILFSPLPLFPAPAGFCVGLLCEAGFSPKTLLGGMMMLLALVGTSIISCSLYRHQAIVPASSTLHMTKRKSLMLQALINIVPCSGLFVYASYPFEQGELAHPYNITWVASRGHYFNHVLSMQIRICMGAVSLTPLAIAAILIFLFAHMFHAISNSRNRPIASIHRIRRSLAILFAQLAVPLATLAFPSSLLFSSIFFQFIPFQIGLAAFCMIALHPLFHNVTLLSVTPSYRNYLVDKISVRQTIEMVGAAYMQPGPTDQDGAK